jgi:type I restriction-modification system DNA methylase subunit
MEREAKIQDALKDLIESAAKGARFRGLEITHVERDYPIDNREADLILYMRGETPFMFIETKRKEKGRKPGGLFDPLDVSAVGQVMSYAAIYKKYRKTVVPFVATANPDRIVIFKTPDNIEDYIDNKAVSLRDYKNAIKPARYRHLLKKQMRLSEKLKMNKEYIQFLLGRLAEEYVEKRVIKAKPTEALIGRFREFVERVAERCSPLVEVKIEEEPLKSEVVKLGYKLDPKNLPLTVTNLTRMMVYVLMNKLIFYKILEGSYGLPPLISLDSSSLTRFREELSYHFERAVEATGDFEPIFMTGVYDRLPISDDPELMDYINDFIFTLSSVDIAEMGEQMGYLYEELVPPEERHQLGQFYTPPWVCELITKWCIREPGDVILDPGVGSGGFLLQAYKVLREKKVGPSPIPVVRGEVHERLLSQLYALDINQFPAHLSAIGLAMRSVRVPSTKMNVIHADFFSLQPEQKVLTPYTIKTVAGKLRREFPILKMDAVIGNPPYTRWTEISNGTQELIRQRLGKLMKKYGLTPQVSRGVEPGIYTYWIMHATDFLKEGGRLGMIISNTWLQTGYGIGFGNFLLNNFRVKAIIDIALRLFKDALITTCIVLAEKESDEIERLENQVAFVHIPGEIESTDVNGLLEAVKTGGSREYTITLVRQRELPKDKKWIDIFFKSIDISSHPLITKLGEFFEPLRGNISWSRWALSHGRRTDFRGYEFFYLSPSKIKAHGLDKYAFPNLPIEDALMYPAITTARQANFFTVTMNDWKKLRNSDARCYLLMCHKPKRKIPREVANYIKWGETTCRTILKSRERRGGRLVSEIPEAKIRARETKQFYGWYDLGEIIPPAMSAIYRAWRKTRFTLCEFPAVMGGALMTFMPKKQFSIDKTLTKAILAYLNSNFGQLYVETKGLKAPGGVIQLDEGAAREIPVLDVRKLSKKQLNALAKLFDKLEREARKIGGVSSKKELEKLKPQIYEIDRAVAAILDIKDEDVKALEAQVDLMVERRVSVARKK